MSRGRGRPKGSRTLRGSVRRYPKEEYTTATAYIPRKLKNLILANVGFNKKHRSMTEWIEAALIEKAERELRAKLEKLSLGE